MASQVNQAGNQAIRNQAGLAVRPLTSGFGAEVIGVDLSKPLDNATSAAIRDIWIEAGVLLFRDAGYDDAAQMRLSRIFGDMEPAATANMNDPDNQYMMTLAYDPEDKSPRFAQHYHFGGADRAGYIPWHWDQSFMPTIVRGAVLRMEKPALQMGQTGFIDAIEAYERLSPAMQSRIEGMEVVYHFVTDFTQCRHGIPDDLRALPRERPSGGTSYDFPPSVHPMVITQRETGRKALKISPLQAQYILGLERNESDVLLAELAAHLCDQRYAYFHEWEKNDMLVWDNWRMIHMANGVPLDCARSARRTTIMGDYAVGRYLDPTLDRDRQVKRIVD
ncbi:TauD/TfdA dioxygenase family protein [Sphingobium yanoikuyae]|uniref:Taurine catabolism dioxygenase TauD n=1 Tax=Sphingobium yanoikuyae TaxID=13690 RepID=A0A291N0E1_SPHYA|nr:TauD/TfdA family dioxygenase [Sphingobium yanoikuyae]ATI80675.1 taurine catabolism dioxygenase TauD [Sphingobium yanoikuyae]